MRVKFGHILILILLLTASAGRTQNYPVQAFVQLSPPYSSYLPDYGDPFNNQLKVILTLTDYAVPSYQVKLRFSIDGQGYSMQSVDLVNFQPITLSPGVPVEISGSDIAPYLATENLIFNGLSKSEYENSKILPEGQATICVEVVDINSPNQPVIGNPACAQSWFALYDPPLLNTPLCGNEVAVTTPQQIVFSWSPLHMVSPQNGMTTYEFELFEMRPDNNADPNQVVNTTLPIYTSPVTNTTFNYGISEPQLNVGMTYVWRVKAIDPSGRALYRNDGYSAVCTFTYGNEADQLLDGIELTLNSEGTGSRQGSAWWNAEGVFDGYELEVRKTGNTNHQWFPHNTQDASLKINNLEPETEYECRVRGKVGSTASDWSNTSVFTTTPKPNYACGSTALPPSSSQVNPLETLLPGNYVQVGQFEMQVTAAQALGPPGHFEGTGKINIPFMLLNLNVRFDDIFIDDNMLMRDGRVDAMTQGVDEWMQDQGTVFIDGHISNIQPNTQDSVITVFLEGGDTLSFDWPENDPLVIQDDSGLIYTINPDGTIVVSGAFTFDEDNLVATKDHQVEFIKAPDQEYGFDGLEYMEWAGNYPSIQLQDGSVYTATYKSVGSNESDVVRAIFHIDPDTSINYDPVFVASSSKNGAGSNLSSTKINDTTYEITVSNFMTSKYIYALDPVGGKLGRCNLSVYASKDYDVKIVPVNGATAPDINALQASIDSTFKQAYTFLTLALADTFSYSFDGNNNGLDYPDDGGLSKYSAEMKALRDAYFEANSKENNTYYLFVVPEMETTANNQHLDGYMVRGKAVGFIGASTASTSNKNKLFAHELAHGAFGLKHTFPQIDQGTTNNLLDYGSGTHLTHEQWYDMQHFNPSFSILDDEEDGGYALTQIDYKCISPGITKSGDVDYYYDLDGDIIKLGADYVPYAFAGSIEGQENIFGNLAAIQRISDGKLFLPKSSSNGTDKHGYFTSYLGVFEEYPYDTNIEPNAQPKKVFIQHDCSYSIEKNGSVIGSDVISDCENCPGIQKVQWGENNKSFFTQKEPNFYTQLFESDSSFVETFNSSIDDAVNLVNNNIGNLTTTYPADDQSKIHLINFNQYATTTTTGIAGLKDEPLKEIENLLQDLYRTTDDHGSPIHFVVLFQYVDFIVDNNLWNIYAGKVLTKSNLKNLDDVVLITIPYSLPALSGGPNPQKAFWMPGLTMTKPNRVNVDNLGTESYDPENFEVFIKDVFIHTVKPYDYYSYVVDCKGRVQFSRVNLDQWKSGYSVVNELAISYDRSFKTYERYLECGRLLDEKGGYASSYEKQVWAEDRADWLEIEWAYNDGIHIPEWKSSNINLKSYCVRQYHSHYFNHYLTDHFEEFKREYELEDPGSVPAYAKINPLADDPILEAIDFFSLLTATVGLDVVFDAIGAVYVYGVAPENEFEISTRTAAVMLPFMNGGVVKLGKEGLEEVTTVALKNFGKKGPGNLSWMDNLVGSGWDDISKTALRSDLNGNPQLATLFREADELRKVEYAESWNLIRKARGNNSIFKTDVDLLKKTQELRANSTFMQRIGGDQGLEDIIKANVRARCKTCGNSGANHLRHIDEYLGDVEHLVINYHDIDGFSNVLSDLKLINSNFTPNLNVEGAAFMLRVLNENQSLFIGNITKFEGSIDDLVNGCRFDVQFNNGNKLIFGEFKSYDSGSLSSFLSSNGSTYQQFTSYLSGVSTLDELKYFFDAYKISDVNMIKNRFKQVFTDNAEDIFGLMKPELKLELGLSGIDAQSKFTQLINDTESSLYNFIDVY